MTDEPRCPAVLRLDDRAYPCAGHAGHAQMHWDEDGARWGITGVGDEPSPTVRGQLVDGLTALSSRVTDLENAAKDTDKKPGPFVKGALDALAERLTKLEADDEIRRATSRSLRLHQRVAELEEAARDTDADKQPDTAPKEPASQLVYIPGRAAPGVACISIFTDANKCIWKCTRDAGHLGRHGVPRYGVLEAERENSAVCDTAFTDAEGSVWTCHRDTGHPGRHSVPSMRVIEAESRTCSCGCGAPTRD